MTKPGSLADYRATLPNQPGVYRYFDHQGKLLYVGKARQLKRRVDSYFQRESENPRIRLLVSLIATIEVTLVTSETEALLLESNLIKTYRPRFNIVFRDDKTYPYLQLSSHEFPRLSWYRGKLHPPHHYYGPYPNIWAARSALQFLQKLFLLRTCDESTFKNRTRPCLEYQIKRCSAPCVGLIGAAEYALAIQQTEDFLKGKEQRILNDLRDRMNQEAQALNFENAALLRDRISLIQQVLTQQTVSTGVARDVDILALVCQEQEFVLNLTMIRQGRHIGDRNLFPDHAETATVAQVMEAFLTQHYGEYPPPAQIISNHPVPSSELLQWMSERIGRRISWVQAPRGMRRVWLEGALTNAQQAWAQHQSQRLHEEQRLQTLQQVLELDALPMRMECFDISHTQGEATVASCVVFQQGRPHKQSYRQYHIDGITPGDDYGAMRVALERRYRDRGESLPLPDLLLIDGGKGQLAVATEVLRILDLQIPVLSIAKGPARKVGAETLWIQGHATERHLAPENLGFHLIQAIRDEAHRFAVSGHRQRRQKRQEHSLLQDIPGIGDKRRHLLLQQFGGLRGVERASEADMAAVSGIGDALARKIYVTLHGAPDRNG
ncbi:excinuclease ABC subunit UvrC [Ferrovum myxofaciens]|jgi:excinuclease ABC subunit C|uniref:UvrABC system protein C n=2 Tax=root TaxID=1 RepID=A0A8F3DUL3_9PROT|nr:excinuclease ABC subunit UvrC [Ferrovum myxofaciens]NDU88796.1 excinuclease ABC subunit UvrC [Ferrovum sp.]KXW58939.1 UvrABC system protein C [Ferrovum myxofaciens]MBU6993893.1 excinuclease ABC subunit UvrC [Ferrovum myxofaciens]QKE37725.1 MAG: excinuclease ABC subunit UvrC [Ferrovum myxofaciens]QKE40203.1 MAG: excinuclease ABC subunit UvrC [Ferrovum myxofaciens]